MLFAGGTDWMTQKLGLNSQDKEKSSFAIRISKVKK